MRRTLPRRPSAALCFLLASLAALCMVACDSQKQPQQSQQAAALGSQQNTQQATAEPQRTREEDSLLNVDVATIGFAEDVDGGDGGVAVYTMKTNGTEKKLLGKVKYLGQGPFILPGSKGFVYDGYPKEGEESGTYLYDCGTESSKYLDFRGSNLRVSTDYGSAYAVGGLSLYEGVLSQAVSRKLGFVEPQGDIFEAVDGTAKTILYSGKGYLRQADIRGKILREWAVDPKFEAFEFSPNLRYFVTSKVVSDSSCLVFVGDLSQLQPRYLLNGISLSHFPFPQIGKAAITSDGRYCYLNALEFGIIRVDTKSGMSVRLPLYYRGEDGQVYSRMNTHSGICILEDRQ